VVVKLYVFQGGLYLVIVGLYLVKPKINLQGSIRKWATVSVPVTLPEKPEAACRSLTKHGARQAKDIRTVQHRPTAVLLLDLCMYVLSIALSFPQVAFPRLAAPLNTSCILSTLVHLLLAECGC
jgi:hypothetical protein